MDTPILPDGTEARWVLGHEDVYSVTADGRVYSHPRYVMRGPGRKAKQWAPGRWLNPATVTGGYQQVYLKGKFLMVHRVMWRVWVGEVPEGKLLDHINQNPADNRLCNLRLATVAQNRVNSKHQRGTKSGFRGVYKTGNRWQAKISVGVSPDGVKKVKCLGSFGDPEEAARAFDEAMTLIHGEFASTNASMGLL